MASRSTEELVLQVSATQELLDRQLREMGRNVDTFEQAAEQRLDQLEKKFSGINLRGAIDAVKDADRAFKASFGSIQSQAERLAESVQSTGRVDLTPLIEQSRNRAAMLQAEATAVQALARAEEGRLASVSRLSTQEQAALAAARAAVSASNEKASAAAREVQRLEELAAQLGQTTAAQNQLTRASSASRAGLQQVGFQVQDFAVQVAGGTSVIRAFSLQAPQLFGALQLMGSGADGAKTKFQQFASFLGGGWGVAIGIAIPFIGMLAEALMGLGDTAEDTKKRVQESVGDMIARLQQARGQVDLADLSRIDYEISGQGGKQSQLDALDRKIAQQQAAIRSLSTSVSFDPEATQAAQAAAERRLASLQQQRGAIATDIANLRADRGVIEKQIAARQGGAALEAKRQADEEAARETARNTKRSTSQAVREQTKDQKEQERVAKAARDAIATLNSEMETLLGRLDASRARGQEFAKSLDTLRRAAAAGLINDNDREAAELKLTTDSVGADDAIKAMSDRIQEGRDRMRAATLEQQRNAETVRLAWADAAQGVLGSFQYLASSLSSGGILDILSAALGIFTTLGSAGVFGGKVQAGLNGNPYGPLGKRAAGGPVTAGMPYLVGERGPELFVPSSSGNIVSNDNLRSPGISASTARAIGSQRAQPVMISVAADEYFDVRVRGQAQAVAAPLAMRAAQGGADLATSTFTRQRRNRIPGR